MRHPPTSAQTETKLRAELLKFKRADGPPRILLNADSDSVGLGQGLRTCTSNQLSGQKGAQELSPSILHYPLEKLDGVASVGPHGDSWSTASAVQCCPSGTAASVGTLCPGPCRPSCAHVAQAGTPPPRDPVEPSSRKAFVPCGGVPLPYVLGEEETLTHSSGRDLSRRVHGLETQRNIRDFSLSAADS